MSLPRPVIEKVYHSHAYVITLLQRVFARWQCDDKIALVGYTMAGDETSGLDGIADQIDVCGMQCPLPVLKARKRLKSLDDGELLRVLATDPAAIIDFPHFCSEAGHELVSTKEDDGVLTFVIRKSHTT